MLDLTHGKKKFLPVKLPDGKTVNILPPKKGLLSSLTALQEKIGGLDDPNEMLDEISDLITKIMSNNVSGTVITREFIEDTLDIGDMAAVIMAYEKFTREIAQNPN